jgi:diguanylate cyclase (GGDEF)-like protein/PAS domain S-box-containing protein
MLHHDEEIIMPWNPQIRLRTPQRALTEWLILAAGVLSTGLILVYMVWSESRAAVAANSGQMRAQALVIEQTLRHQLEGVHAALDGMRAALAPAGGCDLACRRNMLQALERAMPGVRALLATGADGRLLLSADDRGARLPDAQRFPANRPRRCDGGMLQVATVRADIEVSMPLAPGAGCGRGAVVAILDPAYFDGVMRSALYAPDMAIAIGSAGEPALLSVPPGAQAGQAGGDRRLVVRRSMHLDRLGLDRALTITLSRNIDRIDAGLRTLALSCLAGWALFWLACAAAVLLAQRRRTAVERLERAAEAERAADAERIRLALQGASLGLWDWHVPSGRRSVDGRASAILGYSQDEHMEAENSEDAFALVHPDDREPLRQRLDQHLNGLSPSFEAEFRMQHRNGHWVWVQSRGKVVGRAADGSALRMVGTRSDISARKQAEADIAHLAFHDGLTNLPNRRLLMDRLGHALAKCERNGGHGAVLFIDLDNFKVLNDTYGHDTGDRLLEMLAFRLQQVTRDTDTVARLGGDEFVVLLEDLGTHIAEATANAELVAQKILDTLGLPYRLEGQALRSTPSVGVSLFGPAHQLVHDLMRQADMAMYEAKSAGGATFRLFDPGMQAALDASTNLEADLRFALARREFLLYYQPVVDRTGRMTGAEALVRWLHPKNGVIAPGAFIAQAERSGLIVGIGEWVLEQACRQLAHWSGNPATAGLTLAVNVSARQFRQEDFVERLLGIVRHAGIDPRRLKLELTESMLLNDVEQTIGRMQALKKHGIGFSLDDFGTGYSSLSYLQRLPLDQLKIDQCFVRDMLRTQHAASIVQTVVQLATSLGLHVVAEGVEEEAQWAQLRALGCSTFQGYLFGPPMPLENLAGLYEACECPA